MTDRGTDRLRINLQLFAQEKTEPATPKRRREAREKGQVARSAEFGTALLIFIGLPVLVSLVASMADSMAYFTIKVFGDPLVYDELSQTTVHTLMVEMVLQAARLVLPIMALALGVGVITQVAQVGFLISGEALKPKFERLNPIEGFKRIFSKRAAVELVKAMLKICFIGGLCFYLIRSRLPLFPALALYEPMESLLLVGQVVSNLGISVGVLLLVLATADYAFQRYEHNQSLRMTKQEVKEEMRQSEGDPMLRSRLRQRQREIAMSRMIQDVPKADVVVTNPTHIAVALQYDPATMDVPVVLAKGAGRVAERIKEVAGEHNVAIVENVMLARTLFDTVAIGSEIPAELYQAVAEVLAFVYRLRQRRA